MLIDGVTSGHSGSIPEGTIGRIFWEEGTCKKCGKAVGRLRATSIVPMGMGMKRYPVVDPVLYHLSPIMTQARIECER